MATACTLSTPLAAWLPEIPPPAAAADLGQACDEFGQLNAVEAEVCRLESWLLLASVLPL